MMVDLDYSVDTIRVGIKREFGMPADWMTALNSMTYKGSYIANYKMIQELVGTRYANRDANAKIYIWTPLTVGKPLSAVRQGAGASAECYASEESSSNESSKLPLSVAFKLPSAVA